MGNEPSLRFGITPFYYTRQFYFALESGIVDPDGLSVDVIHLNSPEKDQAIVCGRVDATTMSLGKYVISKTVSHTDVLPTDPVVVAAGLSYSRGSGLFSKAGSDVSDVSDVEGRRLGIHDRSGAMTFHKAVLDHHYGVDIDAIDWIVDTHGNLSTAFENGEIDVVERVGDWYWDCLDNPADELLYDLADAWHSLEGDYPLIHLIVMDRAFCEENPGTVGSFLGALRRSRQYREEHRDEILRALADDSSASGTDEVSMDRLREITETAMLPLALTETEKAGIRAWMNYAVEYGVLFEPIPDRDLFLQASYVA